MCISVIGKMVEVKGKKGVAVVGGKKRVLDLKLVDVKKGDFVALALNLAVEKIGRKEALAILDARKGILEAK